MITLYTIEIVINIVASVIAYCIVATLSGCFIAYCAAKAGDRANQEQFISFNPFEHIEIIGMLCLICCGLGWGRTPQIDYKKLNAPHKQLKIVLVYAAQATSYFWIVLACLIGLIKILSHSIIAGSLPMIMTGNLSLTNLTSQYQQSSSLALVISIILMNMCYLGLLLGTLDIVRIALEALTKWLKPQDQAAQQTYLLFIPLLIFVIWGAHIRIALFFILSSVGFYIARVLPF